MPLTSRQRKLRRRQRRVRKLRALKQKLAATDVSTKRRAIIEKIRRISPWEELEE
jgi:HAMP domain-containing protein